MTTKKSTASKILSKNISPLWLMLIPLIIGGGLLRVDKFVSAFLNLPATTDAVNRIDSAQHADHISDTTHRYWREKRADMKYRQYDSLFNLEYETIKIK